MDEALVRESRKAAVAGASKKRPGAGGKIAQQQIQNRPLVKGLTLPFTRVRYVALPSSSGPPEHPKGRRPRHVPSA